MSGTTASAYRPGLWSPIYPFALRPTEVACFLSHRKCWKRIVDERLDAGLILEDDVEFDPEFIRSAVALAANHGGRSAYVRLPIRDREKPSKIVAKDGGLTLFYPKVVALGAQGQLVGFEAARKLLQATEIFDRPVDTFLQMRWVHGVNVLVVWPPTLREISSDLGGSLIQKRTPILGKFKREINRLRYRLAVAYRSRKTKFL